MLETNRDIRDLTKNGFGKSIRMMFDDCRRKCIVDAFPVNRGLLIYRAYGTEYDDWIYNEVSNVNVFVFVYQINGRMDHYSFGRPIIQDKGTVFILYYHDFAKAKFLKNTKNDYLIIVVNADYFLNKIINYNSAKRSILKSFDQIEKKPILLCKTYFNFSVNTILDQIISCPFNDEIKQIYFEAKFLELLSLYLHDLQDKKYTEIPLKFKNSDIKKIYDAWAYLNGNFRAPPTISKLARIAGTNEFKLKKGFKQIFGSTIFEHITNLRMQKAKEILLDGQMNITEASNMVGFNSTINFSKNFKKQFGVNPREFLKHKN